MVRFRCTSLITKLGHRFLASIVGWRLRGAGWQGLLHTHTYAADGWVYSKILASQAGHGYRRQLSLYGVFILAVLSRDDYKIIIKLFIHVSPAVPGRTNVHDFQAVLI